MTGIDLSAIDERWNCATENVGSLAAQYASAQDVPDLLAQIVEVEGERDEALRSIDAHRMMTNEANGRLRALLLSALGLDDDGRTSLAEYVAQLTSEVTCLRQDLAEVERERDRTRRYLDAEVERANRLVAHLMDTSERRIALTATGAEQIDVGGGQ